MSAALVLAHPAPASFVRDAASRAVDGLRSAGHDVEVLDLHALGFAAAMTRDERAAYHGDSPILDPLVAEHAALIQEVDVLAFAYPTWWGGLPAILKGWLDRVLVPGVGFVFDDRGHVRPGLTNVRRIVGVSTYGAPRAYVALMTDAGRRVLGRSLRYSCGPSTRTTWLGCYSVDSIDDRSRREFLDRVERTLAGL